MVSLYKVLLKFHVYGWGMGTLKSALDIYDKCNKYLIPTQLVRDALYTNGLEGTTWKAFYPCKEQVHPHPLFEKPLLLVLIISNIECKWGPLVIPINMKKRGQ